MILETIKLCQQMRLFRLKKNVSYKISAYKFYIFIYIKTQGNNTTLNQTENINFCFFFAECDHICLVPCENIIAIYRIGFAWEMVHHISSA